MIEGVPDSTRRKSADHVYLLTERLLLESSTFTFVNGFGASSFQAFSPGDCIAVMGTKKIIMDNEGVIVFPKLPEHTKMGSPYCYLAKRVLE